MEKETKEITYTQKTIYDSKYWKTHLNWTFTNI